MFALTCVLILPLLEFAREVRWQSQTLTLYLTPFARIVCEQGPWLFLALLMIGHVAPVVINRWRPSAHAVGVQMTCSAVQVIGLFTMWVLLASELCLRAMPS